MLRVKRADNPELRGAGTGVVSPGNSGIQALWQSIMGSVFKVAVENWRKCL